MGDRISIQFKNGEFVSVVLFSHWDGKDLLVEVKNYLKFLNENCPKSAGEPLSRREPDTVIVDFIRYLTKNMKIVGHNYYLGATEDDGDNSDNGHFIIDLGDNKIKQGGYVFDLDFDFHTLNEEDD